MRRIHRPQSVAPAGRAETQPALATRTLAEGRSSQRKGNLAIVIALVAVPVVIIASVLAWSGGKLFSKAHKAELPTEVVRRAPFEVKVTERGNLESANNLTLRCQVEGGGATAGTTILKIVEEGSLVETGQVVVELDSARLRDEALAQQIKLDAAQAALKTAQADVAIQKMQNESDLATAELNLELARLDLRKAKDGEHVQQKKISTGEIAMAGEYLKRAMDRWNFTERLMRKGFTTTKVLDADRVAVAKAKIDYDSARGKRKVLDDFTQKRELAELEANVAFDEQEVTRVKLRGDAASAQRERTLLARSRTFFLETQRHKKLMGQIEACTIRSPRSGIVVHANTIDGGRSSPTPLVYEGATVRERQPLIHLPDLSQMRVQARVHESKITMLSTGLEAAVRVDAEPGETFQGIVEQVSLIPNSASWPNVNLKEYAVTIRLTDDPSRLVQLKPGMTAEVEVLVDRRESALQAPIQACVERSGRYFAWVVDAESHLERHEVRIGKTSEGALEIIDGLDVGEQVVLNPRSVLADEIAMLEQEFSLDGESQWQETPAFLVSAPRLPETPLAKPIDVPAAAAAPAAAEPAPVLIVASLPDLPGKEKQAPADPMAVFNQLDQNHDSQVTEAELPDPMKPVLARLDTNGDRAIDQAEWKKGTCTVPAGSPPEQPRQDSAGAR
jgi:HlyD family secretion protein